ncbi:zinc metallopeptidase [Ruminococcus sp.]|jgi:Zn-dependent membrane protease YugP|uniref:zinc metallopeptidase n=1 Tax=Ruminococcus sp. TaxID=41978 RepID=UPI0026152562|nr:zinc metallopeptidase [Ruminococcus sp.]MCI2113273.1 zinc metallopeptidase [Ruminococcus sp.]MDD6989271.1 zinc metallopeptidase [Ruminococcus sp.]MDY6202125.1 zinc metallopeptidase [Ruminococcus sp.]
MRYFYGFDWTYLVFIVPCIIITLICQIKVQSTFSKYSKIRNSRNITGAQAAEYVLRQNGVTGVRIEHVAGSMTDHFDPRTNVIRLSDTVYNSNSVAAVGVACHEAGHAVQHAEGYLPNKIRGIILPLAKVGSQLSWILILLGLIFTAKVGFVLLYIGIVLFSLSVLFTIATLPVEFNASKRALECIRESDLLYGDEYTGAKRTLQAAAMTYVASALTAIMQLLRLIIIARGRRD